MSTILWIRYPGFTLLVKSYNGLYTLIEFFVKTKEYQRDQPLSMIDHTQDGTKLHLISYGIKTKQLRDCKDTNLSKCGLW